MATQACGQPTDWAVGPVPRNPPAPPTPSWKVMAVNRLAIAVVDSPEASERSRPCHTSQPATAASGTRGTAQPMR